MLTSQQTQNQWYSTKIGEKMFNKNLNSKSFAQQKGSTWKLGACDACESGESARRKPKADC